jgi:isoquinoline 1-oxidoreductase alpha subunit
MRSCALPISGLNKNQKIITIEGLSDDGSHPVQKAWIEAQAPQCGYCQSGQIMQAVALLAENPNPTKEEIKAYMNGNLCRCGTYLRIVKAIEIAAKKHQ